MRQIHRMFQQLRARQTSADSKVATEDEEMSGWYYKDEDDKTVGVFSDDEMKHIAARGGLSFGTLVMHEDKTHGEWVRIDRIVPLRKRIEAEADARRETANAETSEVRRAYVPPRRSWASQLSRVKQTLDRTASRLARAAGAVANLVSATTSLHKCPKCEREFARFDTPGKCPLCGEWELLVCEVCGLRSGAKSFVENKCNCPRCGTKAEVDGMESNSLRNVAIVVAVLVIVIVIAASFW